MDRQEAIKIVKSNLPEGRQMLSEALEFLIPELKESEDERIRQDIITTLSIGVACEDSALYPGAHTTLKEAITWLKKKSEQKSVEDIAKEVIKDKESAVKFLKSAGIMDSNGELAKEYRDEQNLVESTDDLAPILQGYIPTIMNKHGMPEIEADAITETAYYFYSLGAKKRSEDKRPKELEWSEEDEKEYRRVEYAIMKVFGGDAYLIGWIRKFKNKLQSQTAWKPSDEQIRPLEYAIDYFKKKKNDTTYLESLYQDLKKLRDE